jgi:hypothetical protein
MAGAISDAVAFLTVGSIMNSPSQFIRAYRPQPIAYTLFSQQNAGAISSI